MRRKDDKKVQLKQQVIYTAVTKFWTEWEMKVQGSWGHSNMKHGDSTLLFESSHVALPELD